MVLRRLSTTFTAAPVVIALAMPTGAAASFTPGYGPGALTVAVSDRDGRPVAGAVVDLTGPVRRRASTSAAGIVSFVAVPAGRYGVTVRAANERAAVQNVAVTPVAGSGGAAPRVTPFVAVRLEPDAIGGALAQPGESYVALAPAERTPDAVLTRSVWNDVGGLGTYGGIRIAGGDEREVRERLDGVPLPSALDGSLLLAGGPALLRHVATVRGPGTLGDRVEPGTGGILALSTQSLGGSGATGAAGAAFGGAIADLAGTAKAGPLTAGLRLGSAAQDAHARAVVAKLALSSDTQIDGRAYRLDVRDGLAAGAYALSVRSAGITTSLAGARLSLQFYDSGFALGAARPVDDRLHGIALQYDGSAGPTGLDLSYVRDVDRASYGDGTSADSVVSRLALRDAYAVSPAIRIEVAATRSRGTLVGTSRDLAATFALTLPSGWLLDLNAASGTSGAPLDLVAHEPFAAIAAPATSVERSATLSHARGTATLTFEGFETSDSDRFAALSQARVAGVAASFAVVPRAGLGFDLSAAVAHVALFGAATPQRDASSTALASDLGLTNDGSLAALRGRGGLRFAARSGLAATLGATYLDAPNALAPTALVLGDASLRVPLGGGPSPLALRLSGRDVLGGALATSRLPALGSVAPSARDVELTLERPAAP